MFIIGLFLFLFFIALLCSGIVWIAGKIGKLKGKEKEYKKYVIRKSILLIIIMLVVLIADEIVTRIEFNYICKKQSRIKIYQKANNVRGFLTKNVNLPNMFNDGYDFVENYSYLYQDQINRQYLENGNIIEEKNIFPKSEYIVLEKEKKFFGGITFTKDISIYHTEIREMIGNNLLAEKKVIVYNYGKLIQSLSKAYGTSNIVCNHSFNNDFIKQVLQPPVHRKE